jgi:ABC-type multidrug transport system ATPase subunit
VRGARAGFLEEGLERAPDEVRLAACRFMQRHQFRPSIAKTVCRVKNPRRFPLALEKDSLHYSAMSGDVVLRTVGLSKRFRDRWAVRGLELTVRRGEIFGFLGPNGAGKSTTIRMLLSLVRPTDGHVELFGKPLRTSRREVLARVGGLVERPDFYLSLSARRNLQIVAALRRGVPESSLDELLKLVGLYDRRHDRVKTFSHGMKQRLGIAQALLGRPDLVVLDEPTVGLDPQGIKEVRELIGRLSAEDGITVFLSSHLLHEIEQTATHMAIINHGSLVAQGEVRSLLSDQDSVVRIEADPPAQALELLAGLTFVADLRREGESIEARIPRDRIAEVNRILTQAGIAVCALAPKRSLEEFFLAITHSAGDAGGVPGSRESTTR